MIREAKKIVDLGLTVTESCSCKIHFVSTNLAVTCDSSCNFDGETLFCISFWNLSQTKKVSDHIPFVAVYVIIGTFWLYYRALIIIPN